MFRFQKWKVYNDARLLRLQIHKDLLPKIPPAEKFNLASQCFRAFDSVILNIAEGSYRATDKDFAHFLNQANASLYEFVAILDLLLDSRYINKREYERFVEESEGLAKQISAFSNWLKRQGSN